MTRNYNTNNLAPLIFISGQPALKVRLAASSNWDGNEWAWVVNVAPTAAAVLVKFSELDFVTMECLICAALAKVQPAQPSLRLSSIF